MIRRVVGIETEYGITSVSAAGSRAMGADEIARFLFRPVVEKSRSNNVFLANGSRLYLDVGSHPEYATAECDGLHQLIAHDKAGEAIIDDMAVAAEQALAEQGIDASVYIFKNNTDSQHNSYGCHENYLLDRTTHLRQLAAQLVPFLVSRQLICGAGTILSVPDAESTFCFSQRAEHMWDGVSSATTRSRPLINTRDEPHADSERFRRMHIIVGDSNMIETTTLLKVTATRLVVEALEAGYDMSDYAIANPVRAIREISRDLTGRHPVRLANNSTMSALDIQRVFLAMVHTYLDAGGWERDDRDVVAAVVALWDRTLNAVETGDYATIAADIDWAAKLHLIRAYQRKHGYELSHPRLAQIDLTYHDLRPGRGLHRLLEQRGAVSTVVTRDAIAAARIHPPSSTRAALRGRFIAAATAAGADFTVDWVHLKAGAGTSTATNTVSLLDPFENSNERVEELIAGISA